ncbi:MAG TPA: hypothetical protein VJO13_21885, partial [Ktedonobacterales bacterium]|nr:hypothetical protein [Ktedonobacterales bacterium]
MSRRSQVLFGAASIPVAGGLAAVGAFPLVPPMIFGAFFLALTLALLLWHQLAVRAYRGNGVVIFARGPWPVIVALLLIEAICALDVLLAPGNDIRIWLFLGYFLLGIGYLAFLPSALLFWVADNSRLISQVLAFKRSLPWQEIDLMYLESNETTQKQYFITVAKWKDEQLIVEAGPRRSMQVLVRSPLAGGAPSLLLQAIHARATHAAIGIDQLPAVQARRRRLPLPFSSPQPEPNVSLPDAVNIARGPSIPPGWARFSVRRGIIWPNLIIYTLLAIVAVGCAIFIVVSGTIVGLDQLPKDWLVGPQRSLVLYGEGVICIGLGLWFFFSFTLRWLRTLQHPQDYYFLVTPRYVAEVKGQKVEGVSLADVRGIRRSGGGNYGWQIVLEMRNGKKTEYDVGSNYGPVRDLYAYILAALNTSRPAQ